ncbi:hypothetical protein KP509_03G042800 [Ceratopteris richardii]|uniref:Uncharacterized protein n=1 Tax=Ceratopteris richardii TaxID=49495 RepID=A0A8T2UZD5_CERRI|nr:hypothetical protein KP509_03G042800 [Ceratopteris richardii]
MLVRFSSPLRAARQPPSTLAESTSTSSTLLSRSTVATQKKMQPLRWGTKAQRSFRAHERNTADVAPDAKQPPPEARVPSTLQEASSKKVLPVRITLKQGLPLTIKLKMGGCPMKEPQGSATTTHPPPPTRADQAAYTDEDVEAGMRAHDMKCRRLWRALALLLKAEISRRRQEKQAEDTKKLAVVRIVAPPRRKSIVIPFSPYAKIPPLREGLPSPKRLVFYYNKHRKRELPSMSADGPARKRQRVLSGVSEDPATYEWGLACDGSLQKKLEDLEVLHSKLAIKRQKRNGRPSVKNFYKLPSYHQQQRRLADYTPSLPPIAEVMNDENEDVPSCC